MPSTSGLEHERADPSAEGSAAAGPTGLMDPMGTGLIMVLQVALAALAAARPEAARRLDLGYAVSVLLQQAA